jgi:hypothetical protein
MTFRATSTGWRLHFTTKFNSQTSMWGTRIPIRLPKPISKLSFPSTYRRNKHPNNKLSSYHTNFNRKPNSDTRQNSRPQISHYNVLTLPRVTARVGNDLQRWDTLHFEGNETLGSRVLNFMRIFSPYIGFYKMVLNDEELNKCTLQRASHVSYRNQVKLDCVNNMMQCTVHTAIRLAVYESRGCR